MLNKAWKVAYGAAWSECTFEMVMVSVRGWEACLTSGSKQTALHIPGTAKRTTFLSANSLLALKACGMPQEVMDSFSVVYGT